VLDPPYQALPVHMQVLSLSQAYSSSDFGPDVQLATKVEALDLSVSVPSRSLESFVPVHVSNPTRLHVRSCGGFPKWGYP
jgi:hypothetical protein